MNLPGMGPEPYGPWQRCQWHDSVRVMVPMYSEWQLLCAVCLGDRGKHADVLEMMHGLLTMGRSPWPR